MGEVRSRCLAAAPPTQATAAMVPPPSRREQYIRDYAARPKDWFMGGVRVHDRLIGFDIREHALLQLGPTISLRTTSST